MKKLVMPLAIIAQLFFLSPAASLAQQGKISINADPWRSANAAVLESAANANADPLLKHILGKLKDKWNPVFEEQGIHTEKLLVKLDETGAIESTQFVEKPAKETYEQAALAAVKASAPFSKIAERSPTGTFEIMFITHGTVSGRRGEVSYIVSIKSVEPTPSEPLTDVWIPHYFRLGQ
jgi:hypothetical protein